MAKNYLHIPAEGQLDDKSCWAACMKWWYRAAKSIYKSQKKLIAKYNYLTDEYGAMSDTAMEQFITSNKLTKEVFPQASRFTPERLWKHLSKGPVFVAFTETSTMTKHVNVIYDIVGSNNVTLWVMEPQAAANPDGLTYRGEHMLKKMTEFNQFETVIVGSF